MTFGHSDLPDFQDTGPADPGSNARVAGLFTQESGNLTVVTRDSNGGEITQKDCRNTQIIDLCGGGQTSLSGTDVLKLSEFACYPMGAFQTRDVYFVATPRSQSPVFITTLLEVEAQDIKITVFGWQPNGNPSGRVNFDWHCRVQLLET